MHHIELLVRNYLERSNNEVVGMSPEIIQEACDGLKKVLERRFNESYSDRFRLRMSNVGRPTCQLQMEKAGVPREPSSYNFPMQMLIGDIVELVTVAVMRAAGVDIEAVNQKTHIEVDERVIRGEDDVEIDGKVWDVKSCSDWSFKNKFSRGFEKVAEDDAFGYVSQGYAYGKGREMPFGGWIAVNKSSGEITVVEAPEDEKTREAALQNIEDTVHTLHSGAPFKRCFSDIPETFRKKETGNRILGVTCGFCAWKYKCWPGLVHKPQDASSANSPPFKYYTYLKEEEKVSE